MKRDLDMYMLACYMLETQQYIYSFMFWVVFVLVKAFLSVRFKAMFWTIADLLPSWLLKIKFSENEIYKYFF